MGKLIYEGGPKAEIEDRALTHLQLVITAKLRRGEPFSFTWKEDVSLGGGRTTVWIHAGSSLVFKYFDSRQSIEHGSMLSPSPLTRPPGSTSPPSQPRGLVLNLHQPNP